MDDDEVLVMLFGIACSLIGAFLWYRSILVVRSRRAIPRLLLSLTPPLCLVLLLPFLTRAAAHEVRDDSTYVFLFAVLGGAWFLATQVALRLFGISPRDDAIERGNLAAAVATCGAMIGCTLVYAGANIGEGATIWMTIGPAVLATAAFFALWFAFELASSASEAITIDRDIGSAIRLAVLLMTMGVILGRSVAGDYVSADNTWNDFLREGWPALAIAVVAAVAQRALAPSPRAPKPEVFSCGLLPALLFAFIALIDVIVLGPWKGMHQ